MNQEQERQKAKDCADEKSSKAEILVIQVDDFEEWRKFIVEYLVFLILSRNDG